MNEGNLKLVEQLAQKLGTTAEYLWGILVKQAPISATIDLIYFVIIVISGIILFKIHQYLGKETETTNSIYCEKGENVAVPMVIAAMIWVICFIICFFSIGNIINGFFNPEYWALKEILDSCKN